MSGEQIAQDDLVDTPTNSNYQSKKTSKVDINVLLNKIRADQKKEKFENLIFLGLVSVSILVSGIIVSF